MAATKKTVLITGSTRSIGLSLAEYYTEANWNVIGTVRPNSNAEQLKALSPFKVVTLDTSDEASILEAARRLEGEPIDLLINNAGIWVPDTFESATKEEFMRQFEVNAVGPFLTTRALLPTSNLRQEQWLRLCRSGDVSPGQHKQQHGQNGELFHLREKNIGLVTLNPGYVATDMNEHQGYLKPSESAESMAKIVAKLSLEDTGKFFNADTQYPAVELPW
ncbi:NAD(P)-binding domain [Phytophthora cactorum]|nr:NAD(P)-binding domain [Phytophthora cactorum]